MNKKSKQRSEAGKKGAAVRFAKRHELLNELRRFTTKKQLDDIMKSRMNVSHLEMLLGWYNYVSQKNHE